MNTIIKQELDLILDQRRERLVLEAKVQSLTRTVAQNYRSMQNFVKKTQLPSKVLWWRE